MPTLFIPKLWFILVVLGLLGVGCQNTESELVEEKPPVKEKTYELVWADEFEVAGKPDPTKWIYENGFVRNNELQWYQSDNAFVEDGVLVIEGRRDTFPNPNYDPSSEDWRTNREHITYTSSSIQTRGLYAFRYGRLEVRAKIRTEEGLWPAIWTLGEGHEWPIGGEIDIMEYYGGNILANAAWASANRWKPIWDGSRTPVASFDDPIWDQQFHIWRMDWTFDSIHIYVDDLLLNTIDVSKTINQRGDISNPFRDTEQFILLNLAIGGNNGGDPSDTAFPSRYEVDYVRVYQKE